MRAFSQKNIRRIFNFHETLSRHFEHADFIRASETIFHGTQDAIRMASLSFEVEDSIDHVFQDFWPCDRTFFGNMSYEETGNITPFAEHEEFRSTLANLSHS